MQGLAMASVLLPAMQGPAALIARPLAGLIGALAALACLLLAARRRADTATVLLVGLVLSLLFSSLAAALLALGNDRWELGRALVALSLGGIDGAAPQAVALITPLVAVAVLASWHWAPDLDILLSGEDEARSLGVEIGQLRRWVLVWAAVLTAAAVAIGGGVAFVGLVVPNLVRLREGPAHRPLLLASAVGGAAFVTIADVLCRLLHPGPGELPLGVVTSLVGAPLFLILLIREQRAGRW
jgi:iron complex transport system permease protein